ncbi:4-oxalocrotonate tautomerase family protein [uncultured Methylobacterium sp.]|uniref:tautomerase family protein n=1 Tax=uncultured Methylobacterium sp. TaxID=157278 RepID=UPI0035CB0480
MPFVTLKLAADLDGTETARLQGGLTVLMAEVLGKTAELTAVLIERVPTSGWTVGAAPVACAAHLDAKVTQGTNTAKEKARFVADAHALIADVLGRRLALATYVVVDEVPADAWGYGGRTQADRAGRASAS